MLIDKQGRYLRRKVTNQWDTNRIDDEARKLLTSVLESFYMNIMNKINLAKEQKLMLNKIKNTFNTLGYDLSETYIHFNNSDISLEEIQNILSSFSGAEESLKGLIVEARKQGWLDKSNILDGIDL
ncbi:hypothetical protein [uncultured Rossellomorea sp.]|uniref:hypothetical protein n=1 Tax=uncultured Rossellomorea sp. TaxID=2837549 RepID=UPI00260D9C5B|nr:hypothetical protein [uncultured Rossellomorea sp.]